MGIAVSQPTAAQDAPEAPEITAFVAAAEPPVFDTPEAAVEAFKKALNDAGNGAVAALLGLDADKLKADENADETLAAIKEGVAKQLVLDGEGDRRTLQSEKLEKPCAWQKTLLEQQNAHEFDTNLEQSLFRSSLSKL